MKHFRPIEDNNVQEQINLLDIPFDMITSILTHVSVRDVLMCSEVCNTLHRLSQSDSIWFPLCRCLWQGKQLYHNKTRKDEGELSWKHAYIHSLEDSERTRLTLKELLSFQWVLSHVVIEVPSYISCHQVSFDTNGHILVMKYGAYMQWKLCKGYVQLWTPGPPGAIFNLDISRNAHDWGWKMTYSQGVYQTFDPSLQSPRLIVKISPRSGKSYFVTGTFGSNREIIVVDSLFQTYLY
jgi:hypothetical protein